MEVDITNDAALTPVIHTTAFQTICQPVSPFGRAADVVHLGRGLSESVMALYPHAFADRADSLLKKITESLLPLAKRATSRYGSPMPRKTLWYGPEYAYADSYHAANLNFPTVILSLIQDLQARFALPAFNSCLLNFYENHDDSVGWHADDEPELGKSPTIASLSLGATREFLVRRNTDRKVFRKNLPHGSLLLMTGQMQRDYTHCVPKACSRKSMRVNLTFRMTHPRVASEAAIPTPVTPPSTSQATSTPAPPARVPPPSVLPTPGNLANTMAQSVLVEQTLEVQANTDAAPPKAAAQPTEGPQSPPASVGALPRLSASSSNSSPQDPPGPSVAVARAGGSQRCRVVIRRMQRRSGPVLRKRPAHSPIHSHSSTTSSYQSLSDTSVASLPAVTPTGANGRQRPRKAPTKQTLLIVPDSAHGLAKTLSLAAPSVLAIFPADPSGDLAAQIGPRLAEKPNHWNAVALLTSPVDWIDHADPEAVGLTAELECALQELERALPWLDIPLLVGLVGAEPSLELWIARQAAFAAYTKGQFPTRKCTLLPPNLTFALLLTPAQAARLLQVALPNLN